MSHVDPGRIQAYLDGELGDSDCRALESHLATCDRCALLFEEESGVHARAARIVAAADAADEPAWEELVARAATAESSPPDRAAPAATARWRRMLAWAATLVMAFTLGWTASRGFLDPAATLDAPPLQRPAQARPVPAGTEDRRELAPQEPSAAPVPRARADADAANDGVDQEIVARQATPGPAAGDPAPAALEETAAGAEKAATPVAVVREAADEPAARTRPAAEQEAAAPPARERLGRVTPQPERRTQALAGLPAAPAGEPQVVDAAVALPIDSVEMIRWLGSTPKLPDAEVQIEQVRPTGPFAQWFAAGEALRIEFLDAESDERLVLWQGRPPAPEASGRPPATGLAAAVLTVRPDGTRRLRWYTQDGLVLVLEGTASEAALRAAAARIR